MLIRILMIFGTLAFLFWIALWFLRRSLVKWLRSFQPPSSTASPVDMSETLVKCEHCNTFVPKNRAIVVKNHFYCCEEHASLTQ